MTRARVDGHSPTAAELLQRLVGPDATLRPDQAEAISALVDDRSRVLLVQRTGWGKSAVYWIATALRRRAGAGPTLVVSPLLALMRDQVAAARRLGLAAETINSTNPDDWEEILGRLDRGALDVLLISPERLNSPGFRPRLPGLTARLGLLVVDEAHCISDWGHDFRPDYRRIADVLARLAPGTPVLACTATANTRVTGDVAGQLGADTRTLRGRLGRDSLRLAVVALPDAETRLAWLESFVAGHRPVHGRAGVVYTLTVADAHRIAAYLERRGLRVAAYASDVDGGQRLGIEDDLRANRLDAVVSTSALGMGYDKPDLAFVVHVGAPSSPVAYYQQVGRAGRSIDTADVVLLPTGKDQAIWHHFDLVSIPTRTETDALLGALHPSRPTSVPALERAVNVRRSRLDLLLKVLDVDGAVSRAEGGWVSTGRPWTFDEQRYARLADLRRSEHRAMRDLCSGNANRCLMRTLTAQLDDPDQQPCARCAVCTGWRPPVEIDPEAVVAARRYLRSQDVGLQPRRRWPSGLDRWRGNIALELRHDVGRALAAGDESGWGQAVSGLLEADRSGDETTYRHRLAEVVEGLVGVLGRWDWDQRPTAITAVPSRTHPRLLADVCNELGRLGRLPVATAFRRVTDTPRQVDMANAAFKARNALTAYALSPALALPPGPVLLVDVAADSGWTLAVTTALLRETHPHPVLPLVLKSHP